MTGVQTCALPICFPVTIARKVFILANEYTTEDVDDEMILKESWIGKD